MVTLYTIGFTKKSLEDFTNILKDNKITRVMDIRLNRNSQLSGFAKGRDLKYLLENFLNIQYEVMAEFSPTKELLKTYQKDRDWRKYEEGFLKIIKDRRLERFKDKILDEKEKSAAGSPHAPCFPAATATRAPPQGAGTVKP